MTLRTLIVDDEPLARERLKLLLDLEQDIKVIGEARNGPEAVTMLRDTQVDLLFLDVQMPGMTGLEVAAEVGVQHLPPTIFVTAYQEHAVDAFRLAAVDYLTKPFDRLRLTVALERVRNWQLATKALLLQNQVSTLLSSLGGLPHGKESHLHRFRVREQDRDLIIPAEQVEWIEAADYYSSLHVGKHTYLLRESIADLSTRLDPQVFVRVHRSALVNLNYVKALFREGVDEGVLQLSTGQRVKTSRAGRERLDSAGGF
jgi:two-component system LytT family response regulator